MVGADAAVLGSPDCRHRNAGERDCGMGRAAQRNESDGGLAVHDGESAHETDAPLPVTISLADY